MRTVFLTGATGFVGQAVVRAVVQSLGPEDRLYLFVRKPLQTADRRLVVVPGDLMELDRAADILRNADSVIHVAAEARLLGGHDYFATNVQPVRKLLCLLKESNRLERLVFVSSIAAMDRLLSDHCEEPLLPLTHCCPRTAYGRSKLMAEEAIVQSGLPYTIFRPGFVYGPGMRDDSHLRKFACLISRGIPLHRLGFPGRISLIHVDDLAAAMVKCLTSDSGRNCIYLAETEVMPLGEVLAILGKSLHGRRSAQISLPAMKYFFQRFHSRLPVTVAGMFIDYFWMTDPAFLELLPDNVQKRSFCETSRDIVFDLLK